MAMQVWQWQLESSIMGVSSPLQRGQKDALHWQGIGYSPIASRTIE
jgi:hypothetical protein